MGQRFLTLGLLRLGFCGILQSEQFAIVIAAWQLGLALATKVVEEELAVRALRPTQWSGCPKCGSRLHSKGMRSRQIQTLVGRVHWQRRVGRCPQGCKGTQVAPLDVALGVSAFQQTSLELMQLGCILAVFVPFQTAAVLLQRLTGVPLSSRNDLELGAVSRLSSDQATATRNGTTGRGSRANC